jgi:hypothetical protein
VEVEQVVTVAPAEAPLAVRVRVAAVKMDNQQQSTLDPAEVETLQLGMRQHEEAMEVQVL